MAKTRGAHSFRPRVHQGPLPLLGPPLQAPALPPPPLPPQPAPALACLLHAPLLSLLPLPHLLYKTLLLVMLRVPPLWPLPRGDIIPGLAHSTRYFSSQTSPKGPTGQEGPDFRHRGLIHFEIQGATLSTLSGYCRIPRLISGIHPQAALLPLRPHHGEC